MPKFKLLSRSNPKVEKGEAKGFWTFILHLAPSRLSGYQTCPMATRGCAAACLNTAGHGGLAHGVKRLTPSDIAAGRSNTVQAARIRKTKRFFEDRAAFMADLVSDLERAVKAARKAGLTPVFRLNGTSDIRWEHVPCVRNGERFASIIAAFSAEQFYDYTKLPNRRHALANYMLTYSLADGNDAQAADAMAKGMNVAAVFRNRETVARYIAQGLELEGRHYPVASGDETDLRFLDPHRHIIALYAKGNAVTDATGFVRD